MTETAFSYLCYRQEIWFQACDVVKMPICESFSVFVLDEVDIWKTLFTNVCLQMYVGGPKACE